MARPLRLHVPGIAVHVYSRGNNKAPLFLDCGDRERYLKLLGIAVQRFGATCHCFCLMDNHLHAVITPWEHPVARLMHHVNSSYCRWFNERHGRVGHVLQGRYGSRLIDEGSYFLNVVRYVARNPVLAGLVRHPEDWEWSSYRALMGLASLPHFLDFAETFWRLGADTEEEMRARLKAFVDTADTGEASQPLIYGSEAFLKRMHSHLERHRGIREHHYEDRYATRPPLQSLLEGREGVALRLAAREACLKHAYTLQQIGDALGGLHPSTIWRWIERAQRG